MSGGYVWEGGDVKSQIDASSLGCSWRESRARHSFHKRICTRHVGVEKTRDAGIWKVHNNSGEDGGNGYHAPPN